MSLFCSCQVLKVFRPVLASFAAANTARQDGLLGAIFVRYKNKQRIRERKVDIDKEKEQKFRAKKKDKLNSKLLASDTRETRKILAEKPVDNVWVRNYYPEPRFALEEAVKRHQDFAQPAMLDNMEGLVYLDMVLDYTTKKKTKFLKNIRSTLVLPHPFPFGRPPSILVFCKEEEHTQLALSLGARHAGTPAEIIKQIETGVLNPKDFVHVLATADCASEIIKSRSYLRDKYPQKAKGSVGTDLKAMWTLFYTGITYESVNVTESQGKLQVPIGQLKQPLSDLRANFEAYIESVCTHRSLALGPFIQSMSVVAPPSPEEFIVRVEDYVPGYQNEEIDSDDDDDDDVVKKRK